MLNRFIYYDRLKVFYADGHGTYSGSSNVVVDGFYGFVGSNSKECKSNDTLA